MFLFLNKNLLATGTGTLKKYLNFFFIKKQISLFNYLLFYEIFRSVPQPDPDNLIGSDRIRIRNTGHDISEIFVGNISEILIRIRMDLVADVRYRYAD